MSALQSSLYTIALAVCVFSTGILGARSRSSSRRYPYLILYLAAESLGFALELLVAHPAISYKPLWLAMQMASSLLPAPLLYLGILETATAKRPSLRQIGHGPWICLAAASVLLLPLALAAQGSTDWAPPANPLPWHFHWIHEGMMAVVALFAIQVPYYLLKARRFLLASADKPSQKSLPYRAWLHLPLLIVATAWILGMLRVVQCATQAPSQLLALFAAIDVLVTAIALYLIVKREFIPATDADATQAKKYAKSEIDAPSAERIYQKLANAFERERIHTDSDLSLRSLSQRLNEKPHDVSQVINRKFDQTFYGLLATKRVEHAKALLQKDPQKTILEIALEVGFNTKSTFNAAFLRATSRTPSAYRKLP